MSPEQRLEWQEMKKKLEALRRVEDNAFIENMFRRLEQRIDEKLAAINLTDLNDVDTSGVSNNQVIKYNSTSGVWENANDLDT